MANRDSRLLQAPNHLSAILLVCQRHRDDGQPALRTNPAYRIDGQASPKRYVLIVRRAFARRQSLAQQSSEALRIEERCVRPARAEPISNRRLAHAKRTIEPNNVATLGAIASLILGHLRHAVPIPSCFPCPGTRRVWTCRV